MSRKKLLTRTLSLIIACLFVLGCITPISSTNLYVSAADGVKAKLDAFMQSYPNGSRWTGSFDGGIQCYGFAKLVVYNIFGASTVSGKTYRSWTYAGVSTSGMTVVSSITSFSSSNVQNLLAKAKCGDVLQFNTASQHSMIVYSVESDGVWIYDCNWDGNCGIRLKKCSFGSWSGRNSNKLTLLRSDNYSTISGTLNAPIVTSISPSAPYAIEGDNITFNFAATNATQYELVITNITNGLRVMYTMLDVNNFTFKFTTSGLHLVEVNAYGQSIVGFEPLYFEVHSGKRPETYINSQTGEVYFTPQELTILHGGELQEQLQEATLFIYKEGYGLYYEGSLLNTGLYTRTFEEGTYESNVLLSYKSGYGVYSKTIRWHIGNAPTNVKLTQSTNECSKGSQVIFSIKADNATLYYLGIGDGKNTLYDTYSDNGIFSYTFSQTGNYYIWGSASNEFGTTATTPSYLEVNVVIPTYTVTFKDWNGTTLKTQTVNYGSAASVPANPSRTGYTFTGWDKAFTNITANTTVTAKYSINSYTVTFKDWNGTTLKTQTIKHGSAASAPANPSRTGYTFTGWDKAFSNITANTTVTAKYSINSYTVTFKDWDGTTLKTQTVNHGSAASAPANPSRTGYTFTGWDKAFSNITSNTTVTAKYSTNSYTVTFKDWNGTTLKTQTVNYDSAASAPANPSRTGYTFTGWDKAFSNITANTTVTAKYSINSYTVTFKDWDGTTLKTQTVNHGSAASAPANPSRTGYTFTGWDKAFSNITNNLTVTATYTKKNENYPTYTVTLTDNNDGTATITATVPSGIASGKLVIDVSNKLTFISGSLCSVSGAMVNESYYGGKLCISFSGIYALPTGTTVFTAKFNVQNGATLSSNDFTAPEWNLTDGTVKLASNADGDVIKRYEKKTYTLGDVNNDGSIDNLDSAFVLKLDAGIIGSDTISLLAADVNGDDSVDNLDAAWLLKYDAGIISKF